MSLSYVDNVVTEWVSGAEGRPAPKLKDAVERMSEKQMEDAYNQVLRSFLERTRDSQSALYHPAPRIAMFVAPSLRDDFCFSHMLQRPKGPKDESCRPDGPKSGVQGWGRGSGVGDPRSGSVVRGPVHWTYAVVRWVWGLVGTVGLGGRPRSRGPTGP